MARRNLGMLPLSEGMRGTFRADNGETFRFMMTGPCAAIVTDETDETDEGALVPSEGGRTLRVGPRETASYFTGRVIRLRRV